MWMLFDIDGCMKGYVGGSLSDRRRTFAYRSSRGVSSDDEDVSFAALRGVFGLLGYPGSSFSLVRGDGGLG